MFADEDGFTLVELLVTMLLIGILATIAIPAFFNQTAKAKDTGAKSDLRQLVELVEQCRVGATDYTKCDEATELKGGTNLTFGASPGNVGVVVSGPNDYTAYAVSEAETGGLHHLFAWLKSQSSVARMCAYLENLQPFNAGGCSNGTW